MCKIIFLKEMDLTAGISLVLPQNIAYPVIYVVLTVMAVVSVVILKNIRRRRKEGDSNR